MGIDHWDAQIKKRAVCASFFPFPSVERLTSDVGNSKIIMLSLTKIKLKEFLKRARST
jgi:hypothetical protein